MFKAALRSLLSHKLRMFLTAFSIVMGVSFVAGTYIFTDSINKTFSGLFDDVFAGIDLTVRPLEPEFGTDKVTFDESLLEEVSAVDGVRIVAPSADGVAQLIDKDGIPIGGGGVPTLGFSWTTESELSVLRINENNGRPPEALGEIVIDANTAKNYDFAIGDTISVQPVGPLEDFTIVGIASFGEADTLAGASLAVFELEEAQRLFGMEGQYSEITVKIDKGASLEEVQASVATVAGDSNEVVTGEQQTQEAQNEVSDALGFINTALLSFAGISIFVGGFIIQNTFRIIVSQRSKELALYRAIGATRKQVIRLVMYEALLVGILASAIGILVGVGVANGIRGAGNAAGLGLPGGDLTLLPRTIIAGMSVGVIITLLSALVPAIRASRVSPVEALSDNESSTARKSLKKRGIMNAIIASIGAGSLMYGLFGDASSPIYYVGSGVAVMFMGISGVAPLLSSPLANVIGYPFARLRGMSGRLAQENTKRTPRRTASTASALMIGVALVTLVSVFAASVNATVEDVVAKSFPADLIVVSSNFTSFDSIPPQYSEQLRAIDGIEVVSQIRYDEALIDGDVQLITAVDPADFDQVVKIKPSDGAYERLEKGGIIVRSTYLQDQGWVENDTVAVDLGDGNTQELAIVGTFDDDFDTKIIVSRNVYTQARGTQSDTYLSANYERTANQEEVRAEVDELAAQYPTSEVQNIDELVEQQKEQINQILGLFWALLGFAILIAVLGITNTMALSVAERTREIGLLRAIGMTKKQVRSMVRAESIIISLFGATLGIAMGTFFAWAILKALESEGLTSFVIPVNQIIMYYILAAIAGVLAAIWPAFSASRVNVLDAINFE
jgi:putative ABC transport system permease protein